MDDGRIIAIHSDQSLPVTNKNEMRLVFDNAIAFPGLINSHDHLDFNLFPQLRSRVYKNYKEWGKDIQLNNKQIIDNVLRIPKELRIKWGIYKNLVNGVTTVVSHGQYADIKEPVIDVFQECHSLHSVEEKSWKIKLNRPYLKRQPFVIHVGEGTDTSSFEEIDRLIRWNVFKRKIIAVHGVAMNTDQAKAFEALIWCPDSNYFLLNATAKINKLKKNTKILFGTDSTLSANWNIWEQLRIARNTKMMSDEELFNGVTSLPAAVWKLREKGSLVNGYKADIVIAKARGNNNSMDNFFELNPEDILLIVKSGQIILFDDTLYSSVSEKTETGKFSPVTAGNSRKYIYGDFAGLTGQIKKHAPGIKLFLDL